MPVSDLVRNVGGSVRFSASGGFAVRMLGLCAEANILLHRVKATDFGFEATVAVKDYKKLVPLARKTRTRLHIIKKEGGRIWLLRNRRRKGLVLGVFSFAILLALLSRFVWSISIDGSLDGVSEEQLRSQLREFGVHEGVPASSIDADFVERSMMIKNDELSFIAVNVHGSTVEVLVRQRDAVPGKEHDSTDPANLVSLYDGIVRRIRVYTGKAEVKPGDTVSSGDLLVSGIVETANGKSSIHHATGEVWVEHTAALSVSVPLQEEHLVPAGTPQEQRSITILGINLPLSLPRRLPEQYQNSQADTRIRLFGVPLPVTLHTQRIQPLEQQILRYTEEEAQLEALRRLEFLEQEQLGKAEILQKQLSGVVRDGIFLLTAEYLVLEDAALEKNFSINS